MIQTNKQKEHIRKKQHIFAPRPPGCEMVESLTLGRRGLPLSKLFLKDGGPDLEF